MVLGQAALQQLASAPPGVLHWQHTELRWQCALIDHTDLVKGFEPCAHQLVSQGDGS